MRPRKSSLIQNINPRTIFVIIIWLIFAWVLSRPLQGIGENIYLTLGSFTNNIFDGLSHGKVSAEELLKSKKLLEKKNRAISELTIKINSLENEVKETEKLKSLLDLKKDIKYKTLPANVIGRSADNWHKQIIINKGTKNNIMIGDSVLTSKGIIGQVVEADKNSSIVQLISDPSYKLGCKVEKRKVLGILSGKTNSIGLLEFIPEGTEIMAGDLVEASGIASGGFLPTYPAGHPVGRIIKISRKKSRGSDLYIEVKLLENLNSLSNVLVFSPG